MCNQLKQLEKDVSKNKQIIDSYKSVEMVKN